MLILLVLSLSVYDLKVQNRIRGMRHSAYAKIDPPPRHPFS